MPRLTTIEPANATGKAKEIFDGPLKAMQLNIFKGIANSPAVLEFYLNAGGALKGGVLSDAEREAIQLTVSEANQCEYCLAAHTYIGKAAGLSEQQTIDARRGAIQDDAKLGALTRFAASLHEKRGFVSDEDLSAFKGAGYDDAAVVETIATYALITFTNYFNHVNKTDVDLPAYPAI